MIKFHPISVDGFPDGFRLVPSGTAFAACAEFSVLAKRRIYKKPFVYYLVTDTGVAVGCAGFVDMPQENIVDIMFHVFEEFEGRGYGKAFVAALIKIKDHVDLDLKLRAFTTPVEGADTKILERAGFEYIGIMEHDTMGVVWQWILK
jgi:RimJ/RimL family protein N-acetyltransferase